MSNQSNLSSTHAPPNWQGNSYFIPKTQRLYYYGVAVFFFLLASALMGISILLLFSTFTAAPPASIPWLSGVHPIIQFGLCLVVFVIGFLVLKYVVELYFTVTRTMLLIAPEGFLYTSNGGWMWSSWDNTMRIERLFIHNSWQEGIMLRVPANIAGRTIGFSIFSISVLPWDRFIPLTPFGALWRMPITDRNAREEFASLARWVLPAHSIPNVSTMEGALYHDIHRYAEHLFVSEW